MIRPIKTYPEDIEILRKPAKEVADVTDEVRSICSDMIETMQAAHGVGLAANQIGLALRIVTVDTGSDKESAPVAVLNPRIVSLEGEETAEEGCLSIPGYYETVRRAKKALVRGITIEGEDFRLECSGLVARAFQHEIDHLEGILFIDHLSPVKKQLFKREFAKEKK
jgi:peptide deformylase